MIFDHELYFYGQYAEVMKKLASSNNSDKNSLNIFKTNYDLFISAAALGLRYEKVEFDAEKNKRSDFSAHIFQDKLMKSQDQLKNLFIVTMLTYDPAKFGEEEISDKERIERAFRVPNLAPRTEEEQALKQKCEQIVYSYALGGLKYLKDYLGSLYTEANPKASDVEFRIIYLIMDTCNLDYSDFDLPELQSDVY